MIASQDFTGISTSNQIGDRFYVPAKELLLVLGNAVPSTDRNGNQQYNADGTPKKRSVGQHFPAVRVVDGKVTEVTELYVGQLVKIDAHRAAAFPESKLFNALRAGSNAFKDAICDKVLEIIDQKEVDDRVWDSDNNAWKKDENGQNVLQRKNALRFEPKASALQASEVEKANKLIIDFVKTNYPDFIG
jgi:hypothetical protein